MIQQRELLPVCDVQKECQRYDRGTGDADDGPGRAKALGVQNTAHKQVSKIGKQAVENGDKGIDPAPVGGGHPAGHIGLISQGFEDLPQGENHHQHKIQGHLQLHIPIAEQAQNNQGLAQKDFSHIPDFSQKGGDNRGGENHGQGIDAGEQTENLRPLGPVQGLHVQRQQVVELPIDQAAEARQQGIDNQAFPLPQNGQGADTVLGLFILADVGFLHGQPLDKQNNQQGGGEGRPGGDEKGQPQVVFKEEAAQGGGQHQPQVHAQVLQAVGLLPGVAVAEVRNQSIVGGALNGGKDTGDVEKNDALPTQRQEARKDIAGYGYKVTKDDNMLPIPAVRQLAAQQEHGKLKNGHGHGNDGNGGGIVAQLVFENQGHERPDEGPHTGDDAPPKEYVNFPAQMPVLVQKFW